jgi:predicted nucleotide-binding protein
MKNKTEEPQRVRINQSDVPMYSLNDALKIPRALADAYGKKPTKPLRVAEALDISPTSTAWRYLSGAAVAYELVTGGYGAPEIGLTPIGRRIVAPTLEGDDAVAKREAVLKPRVFREFLTRYNNSKMPPDKIACNVLEELGVPLVRVAEVLELLKDCAGNVGFFREVKGAQYVDLDGIEMSPSSTEATQQSKEDLSEKPEDQSEIPIKLQMPVAPAAAAPVVNNRVFITHGKNTAIVTQLKELLTFGSFVPVVSVENETVSKPVPDKVMDDMRGCSAAIIHVGKEQKFLDEDGKEHILLNPNVLIEIGAAMALYGRRFILLVERGVTLPSNLQGLYEVRYEGEKLDYEATMRLLKAFNDFKK